MPDIYFLLKFLHLLGAAILFGTGIGIAFFQFIANRSNAAATAAPILRIVVLADFVFTASAVVLQPATGVALAFAAGHAFSDGWLAASIALYLFIGCCWLPVVVIQIRMRDLAVAAAAEGSALPERYHRLMRVWFWLGWPAFAAILAIYWLMIARPDFGSM